MLKQSALTLATLFSLHQLQAETLQVGILGLGGRAQDLLAECVLLEQETGKTIQVAAVCDDHAKESYDFFTKHRLPKEITDAYTHAFTSTKVYPDTDEGVQALLSDFPDLDRIFIASVNGRHAPHFKAVLEQSECKNIYLEKPLFKSIEEFSQFNHDLGDRNIQVGLTLRSAQITKLAAEHLKKYRSELGTLKKVHSWEHVNFGHSYSIIMMNWRRFISQSGGLLIEKSVHDLDLAYFFMESVGVHPRAIKVKTETGHNFYTKANKEAIIDRLLKDARVRECAQRWEKKPWQHAIEYAYDRESKIDWRGTMDNLFHDFPESDDFSRSDLIPDTQWVHNEITTTDDNTVEFDLDLKLNGFATQTDRGCRLSFENGEVEVEMETSHMVVKLNEREPIVIDLNTRNIRHAGGDVQVAHGVLGTLPDGYFSAQFSDPSVQISSVIGLVSEHQALHHLQEPIEVNLVDGRWNYTLPR